MHTLEHITPLAPIRESLDSRCVEVLWEPQPQVVSAAAAEYIDRHWLQYAAEARAAGKTLFDGPITRLLEVRTDRMPHVVLRLGPSNYKTFLVTRLRDRAWFDAHAPADVSLALGNSALLTCGDEALLGLRSDRVSAYPRRLHSFGGVVEALGTARFPASTEGLLAHLRLELDEEAHLKPHELEESGPRLLSAAMDDFLGQPEIIWQWKTRISLKEVAARLDDEEHADFRIVRRGEMSDPLWQEMTPMAREAWRAWSGL